MSDSNSVTIVPLPQLLQLPKLILDEIIFCLRQSIEYDGYLCHLRLVNKKFNEVILRCLCFRQVHSHRKFWRSHHLSCPDTSEDTRLCYIGYCCRFGDANEFYAHIKFQAEMQAWHRANLLLRSHYEALNLATSSLRKILEPSSTPDRWRRSTNVLISINSDGTIYTNPVSTVLCKAVLEFFDITDRWKPTGRFLRDKVIYNRTHTFWQDLTLCYIGHMDFLNRLADPKHLAGWVSSMSNDENVDLLTMAAFRGHADLAQRMLPRVSLSGKYAHSILTGACFGANVGFVDLLLDRVPAGDIPMLCMDVLARLGLHPRLPKDAEAIFERLVHHINPVLGRRYDWNFVLAGLIRTNQSSLLSMLLARLRDRHLHPDVLRVAPICFGMPAWIACVDGDLDNLRSLLEGGYLQHAPKEGLHSATHAYEILFEIAAYSNKAQICMELLRRLDRSLEEMPLFSLAALDGTGNAMICILNQLENCPSTIGTKLAYESRSKHARDRALYHAVRRLRVANAAILLAHGIRGGEYWSNFKVEWRYKCKHEQAFADMQALLDQYSLNRIKVLL